MEAMEFRKALSELRAIWVAGNEYLTRAAPWTHIKTDRDTAAVGVRMGLNLVHLFGHLSWPVIPNAARAIHDAIMPAPEVIPWPGGATKSFLNRARGRAAHRAAACPVREDHRRTAGRMDRALRGRGLTMTGFRIVRLEDVAAMRDLRLEMLTLHPEAFAADLDTEAAMSLQAFAQRAATSTTFGGYVGDTLAGSVVFFRPDRVKLAHTGELGAMYVRAAHRGSGLADALIEAVIDCAIGQVEQLQLTVNAENPRAVRLYERHGFEAYGRKPRALRVAGRTYDEILMMRRLAPHR